MAIPESYTLYIPDNYIPDNYIPDLVIPYLDIPDNCRKGF